MVSPTVMSSETSTGADEKISWHMRAAPAVTVVRGPECRHAAAQQRRHPAQPGAVQAARLGLCPQRNVLFDTLTVREHLVLFAAIRGMPGGFENSILIT